MIKRKLFEKIDDNPGEYFGMLLENNESTDNYKVVYCGNGKNEYTEKEAIELAKSKGFKNIAWVSEGSNFSGNYNGDSWLLFNETENLPDGVKQDAEEYGKSIEESLKEDMETGTQIKTLQKNLKEFKNSWIKVNDVMQNIYMDEGVINDVIADGYPFDMSFDELSLEVMDWLEDCIARCDWLYDEAQKNESLKESYSKSDLYAALEYMYGFNKKEANDWIKKASDKMKQSVVDGWKGNAKKSALTDSLKEDKFVPKDKMSKKAQKELNDKKRGTWGNTNPVTRVQPNKKAYDRKRDKKELDKDKSI